MDNELKKKLYNNGSMCGKHLVNKDLISGHLDNLFLLHFLLVNKCNSLPIRRLDLD